MKREFFLQDDKSNKFWTIEVMDAIVITTNGRVGSKPRETRKEYPTTSAAVAAAEKEALAKRKKGYAEGSLADIPAYDRRLPPKVIRINHDDYHAAFVGRTSGGDQFFLTHPFAPAIGSDPGGSFVALYVFDQFGALKEARIHKSLPTATEEAAFAESLLGELGEHRFGNIRIAPFSVEAFGRRFGLVFDPGEEEDDDEGVWVTAEPGNYMAFYPPWDGEYDT
jgi:predicted DNA-binding WGR domain protein